MISEEDLRPANFVNIPTNADPYTGEMLRQLQSQEETVYRDEEVEGVLVRWNC